MLSGKPSFSLEAPLKGKAPFFALALFLFLAVDALYGKFLWSPLVFDDYNFFDGKIVQRYGESMFNFDLRWFAYASLGWTYKLFGPLLIWFRMGNMLLHFATALVLFFFLRRLFIIVLKDETSGISCDWLAFFAAIVFALDPVSVYAAGYLIQRTTLMATFFGFLMLFAYMEGVAGKKSAWFPLSALFYFLAVFSKEHAVMFPAVALALTFLLQKPSLKWLKQLWLPFLLFAVIGIFVVMKAKGVLGAPYEIYGASMVESEKIEAVNAYPMSILTQCLLFFKYLLLWIFPNPSLMSVDMREPFASSYFAMPQLFGFIAFLVYPVIAIRLLLKGGRVGLAGFGMLFPWMLFTTELSTVRIQESFVLYRSYLWVGGMFAALPLIFSRIPAKFAFPALLGLSILLFPLAKDRLVAFSSPLLLWGDAARLVEGRSGIVGVDRIYYNLGLANLQTGHYPDAVGDFDRVIAISPKIYQAWYNRGFAYYYDRKYDLSIRDLDRTVELNPAYAQAYFVRALAHQHLNDGRAMPDFRESCGLGYARACEKWKDLGRS